METNLHIISAAITDRGLSEKRPQNEDSFLEISHCGVFAVADGVGGAEGGEVASQMAMEILGEAFTNKHEDIDAEAVLRKAIESANAAIYQTAQELSKLSSMATTIVALHISSNIATIGHVGDSRLYRVDPGGNLHRETEDHSMVADEVRAGRMTEDQAENHPSRNVINRALGAEPIVEVDLKTLLVEPGTSFLICSDGITRHVSDDEIKEILITEGDLNSICDYLKTLCYERGAEDNLTAVVVKVTSEFGDKEIATGPMIGEDEEDTLATARVFPDDESVETITVGTGTETETQVHDQPDRAFSNTGNFLSLGGSNYQNETDDTNAGIIKKAAGVGLLLLGCILGFAVYHFTLVSAPKPQPPQLSEMKSDNIAVSSFEKLRRTVDADPAAYLKEVPPAQDAEDFYLQGRAYLLRGDSIKARSSLLEAQKHLPNSDLSNSQILAADIAAALVIANDVEMQKRFKSELENTLKTFTNSSPNINLSR
jgi:serine/threonine protein phosphatase PrpC